MTGRWFAPGLWKIILTGLPLSIMSAAFVRMKLPMARRVSRNKVIWVISAAILSLNDMVRRIGARAAAVAADVHIALEDELAEIPPHRGQVERIGLLS